jgi:hypothetical protein
MKPTFALNLSNERVGLLHRTGRGWMQIGDVAFDTPDLSEALDYLRKTALGLSPRGVTTKLVIPNSEILYCDVEAPGPDDDTRRTQIRAGLAGRTPYAPEDLVFDWRGKGTMVKVAVVARETLAEAEAFAVEHRFGPVSFVGLPDPSQFKGEPFFGLTDAAKTILTKDETVEADRDAMTIVTRDLPLADVAMPSEDRPAKRSDRSEKHASDPIAGAVEKLRAAAQADTVRDNGSRPVAEPEQPPAKPVAALQVEAPPEMVADEIAPALPVADKKDDVGALVEPAIDEAPFADLTDPALVADARGDAILDDMPPAPSPAAQMAFASRRGPDDGLRDADIDTRPARDKPFGDLPGAARTDAGAKRSVPPLRSDAQVTAPSIPGSKKRKAGPSTPPPAVAAAAAALATSGATMGKPTKPLTRPGGTFGAKPLPRRGKPRYLGLILTGLLLVFLALIAAWSSYSLVQNEADTSRDTSDVAANTPGSNIVATPPGIDDEILADQQDGPLSSDALSTDPATVAAAETAASVPEEATIPDAIDDSGVSASATPAAAPEAEAVADGEAVDATDTTAPEPRPDTLATTGAATNADATSPTEPLPTDLASAPQAVEPGTITDPTVAAPQAIGGATDAAANPAPAVETVEATAPEPAPSTPAPDLGLAITAAGPEPRAADAAPDEIFLATADTAPAFQDALKLPDPAFAADTLPAAAPPPPPFGTVYQFDAAGLIVPTADGILSPEGYMLFAGAPPLTPPARSPAILNAVAAATLPQPTAAPDPAADALAATAAASLVAPAAAPVAAPSDPAMAGFRPRPRPQNLDTPAAAESADDASLSPETDTRVALLRPRSRPGTLDVAGSTARNDTAAASLTAQANAAVELAVASAAETGNIMTLAVSRRPAARPQDMSRAVNAAVAAAVRAPEPEVAAASNNSALPEDDAEPELASAAPKIPTKATVAKQATFANAINLSKVNLIGVYGTPSKRYALIRLASGRYKKVSVGDSFDGGRVEAITASELRYQKSGRLVSLKMPRA